VRLPAGGQGAVHSDCRGQDLGAGLSGVMRGAASSLWGGWCGLLLGESAGGGGAHAHAWAALAAWWVHQHRLAQCSHTAALHARMSRTDIRSVGLQFSSFLHVCISCSMATAAWAGGGGGPKSDAASREGSVVRFTSLVPEGRPPIPGDHFPSSFNLTPAQDLRAFHRNRWRHSEAPQWRSYPLPGGA
jgi:hypothetical protein